MDGLKLKISDAFRMQGITYEVLSATNDKLWFALLNLSQFIRKPGIDLRVILPSEGCKPADAQATLKDFFAFADTTLTILLAAEEYHSTVRHSARWTLVEPHAFASGIRNHGATFFRDTLISNFPLKYLNPYQSTRAVDDSMFFGRSVYIQDIVAGPENYILVGPRRGGKTSLASHVARQLRTSSDFRISLGKSVNSRRTRYLYSVAYIDLASLVKLEDIWEKILKDMGLEQRDVAGGIARSLPLESKRRPRLKPPFEILYDLLRFKYKKCLILLDEVDQWLEYDRTQNWAIFGKIRVLVDDPGAKARVIILGYEKLLRAASGAAFPLNGRHTLIRIANLDRRGALELIEKPLSDLGVRFRNLPEIANMIDGATGGMPNLIQDVCRALIYDPVVEEERQITPRLVAEVLSGQNSMLINSVYSAFVNLEDPLPRLIAYISAGGTTVNVYSLLHRLRSDYGIDIVDTQVRRALDYLYLHNVFHISQDEFAFASDLLQKRLQQDLKNDYAGTFLKTLVSQVRQTE